ncbi:MAG: Hpt domain-containing protein, partial [Planctomycetaceae bacterium]|nr:Hpt domain-containing protein [Planctomycetaceae bacterium]
MEMLDEIVSEFLVESYESLDQLDRDLMALEESPEDRDRMASIFRTIHTIKGTSGFLAFPKLERLAHVGENLLVPLRDGELHLTQDIANSLLAMVDGVRSMLGSIESGQGEGDESYEGLICQLEALKSGGGAAAPPTETAAEASVADE